jgi:hypothetical protein
MRASVFLLLLVGLVSSAKRSPLQVSRAELLQTATDALQSLALSGALDIDTRLDDALWFNRAAMDLESEVYDKIEHHAFQVILMAPTHSINYWYPGTVLMRFRVVYYAILDALLGCS